MNSILDLELAVLNDKPEEVRDILNEIDKKTENMAFVKAAERFGFSTAEHHGRRLAMRTDIANAMGYSDESGMRKLCERYDLEDIPLGQFQENTRARLVQELGLNPQDRKTVFIGWDAFLVGGMQGTSEQARQIKIYLLESERGARVAGGALAIRKERKDRVDEGDKVISMLKKADSIQDANLRARALHYVDDVVDGALKLPKQTDLFDN